jgi:molybdenum cofactor biosynthesis enzyme MoaA
MLAQLGSLDLTLTTNGSLLARKAVRCATPGCSG